MPSSEAATDHGTLDNKCRHLQKKPAYNEARGSAKTALAVAQDSFCYNATCGDYILSIEVAEFNVGPKTLEEYIASVGAPVETYIKDLNTGIGYAVTAYRQTTVISECPE